MSELCVDQGEIRDTREFSWFSVDNAIIDNYGVTLGPNGLLAYMLLARHADNKTQACFPGIATMAKLVGVSYDYLAAGIKKLKEVSLIEVRERRRADGGRTSNEYVLLKVQPAKKDTVPPPAENGYPLPLRTGTPPAENGSNNNTQINKTHTEEEKELTNVSSKEGKPSPPPKIAKMKDHVAQKQVTEFCATSPVGKKVKRLLEVLAEENKTGVIKPTRAWRFIEGFIEQRDKNPDISTAAWEHGLSVALDKEAPNIIYAKKAAKSYEAQAKQIGRPTRVKERIL